MEAVKATLPGHLLRKIEKTQISTVGATCYALVHHLSSNETCLQASLLVFGKLNVSRAVETDATTSSFFVELVESGLSVPDVVYVVEILWTKLLKQLTDSTITNCAKDLETALEFKRQGNKAFGSSSFQEALGLYTEALQYAPLISNVDKSTVATLFVNRAAASHAMELLDAAEKDCTRAIELQPDYSKAWYRRGRVRDGLHMYGKAVGDLQKAFALETSLSGRNQIACELTKVTKWASGLDFSEHASEIPTVQARRWEPGESHTADDVQSCWTSDKQWGLNTKKSLQPGLLVLEEEPYAAIILKRYRKTHCHFCFKQLPPSPIPCSACAIPIYCDESCRHGSCGELSQDVEGRRWRGEHNHECGGASWSAVLPPDAVLALRLLSQSQSNEKLKIHLNEMCHHFDMTRNEVKVELHLLAAVLAYCFSYSAVYNGAEPVESLAAKLVCLISQVRANAMAIVSIHSPADNPPSHIAQLGTNQSLLCEVEQVNVAQAVYAMGSKMNHSCSPNVHASFQDRHLRVRTIVPVQASFPLELCYGAQVGETGREERQSWLREKYFFTCACTACMSVTKSDLLLFAFRCSRMGCNGVVPGSKVLQTASDVINVTSLGCKWGAGRCMVCDTTINLKHATNVAKEVLSKLERAQSELQSQKDPKRLVQGALQIITQCRDIFHASSKEVAKAEDFCAQVLCAAGQPQDAIPHCNEQIKILEIIYGKDHIAVANERLKLVSVTILAGHTEEARTNLTLADHVMAIHYGPDFLSMLPFQGYLHKAVNLAAST